VAEYKNKEKKNGLALAGAAILLAAIIGTAILVLGGNGTSQENTPLENGSGLAQENKTLEVVEKGVDWEPPTEQEVPTHSLGHMTVQEIADAWDIRADYYLFRLVDDYQLEGNYTVASKLSELQKEGGFSTQRARDLATETESIKQELTEWEWPEPIPENEDGEI